MLFPRARKRRRPMRTALVATALLLVTTFLPTTTFGNHLETMPNGQTITFAEGSGGNEWWVEVHLGGSDGPNATSVDVMTPGGPWIPLQSQNWNGDHTWWATSTHIPPTEQVRFRAAFPD